MSTGKLYIDLDSILDTRIATIAGISDDIAGDVLAGDYHERLSDCFWLNNPELSETEYRTTYARRNLTTLKRSYTTNVFTMVSEMLKQILLAQSQDPTIKKPSIEVNIYPYNLSEEIQTELLRVIGAKLATPIVIKMINIPVTNLTPAVIKQGWSVVIMYSFIQWFDVHNTQLLKCPIPDIEFFVPKLGNPDFETLKTTLTFEDDETRGKLKDLSQYDAFSIMLLGYLSVEFIPPITFSLFLL